MIMRAGQQLLLPVNPAFMWGSLVVAMMINMLPLGRVVGMPDVLALTLVFWNVHQPRRVGVGAAFVFGLLVDVHQGALLGQHALSYTLLSYFAITIHRRLLWFNVRDQALQVLPLFVAAFSVSLAIRMIAGAAFPGGWSLMAPVWQMLLWPVATWWLLAPQRRPPDPDEHRPL